MSLTMMAIRLSVVEALKAANTLVGPNVLNSQIGAIDQTVDGALTTDAERPFIAVYTDYAKSGDADALANTGYRVNGDIAILLNCGVSMAMTETNADGESEIVEGIPATDAAFEAVIDVLGCQMMRALAEPTNPWADVYHDMIISVVSKEQFRSSTARDGTRLAAGQIKLTVKASADPQYGQARPDGSPWSRFLALCEINDLPELELFRGLLGEAGEEPAYPSYEALMGMAGRDVEALLLRPCVGTDETSTITDPVSDAEPVT